MKKLYSFSIDTKHSFVGGLFIAEEEAVKSLIDKTIYFGEVDGKYSEIRWLVENGEIRERSDDQSLIATLESIFGETLSGYNPFDYLEV